MSATKKLHKLSHLFQRLGFFIFSIIWVDLIIMIFTDYSSLGQTIYTEYGETAMSLYFGFIFGMFIFLSWSSTQLSIIEREYSKNNNEI